MVRMSKAKQDKLESIMHLVEQLGIDRVLGRLRQTKMMSKDVLDDMKEWETDYEKRVALLGFLVSPEGKRAFGALYELSKVHEEQLKLQEEQEKLRQEQLAQQSQNADLRKYGGRGKGGAANANMKYKLRAQLAKRREVPQQSATKPDTQQTPPQPQSQQIVIPTPSTNKSAKRSPMVATANTAIVENGEAKTAQPKTEEPVAKIKEKPSKDRKSPSPIQGGKVRRTSEIALPPGQDVGLDLSLTGSAAIQIPQTTKTVNLTVNQQHVVAEQPEEPKSPEIVEEKPQVATDGQWGRESSVEAEVSEEDVTQEMPIEGDRPPPDDENAEDKKDQHEKASNEGTVKKVRISSSVKVIEVRESAPNSPSTTASTPVIHRRRLNDIHQKLLNGEISVDKLTMDQIKEIVAEWQIMKKDHGGDGEYILKELQHTKDDLKKMTDEKDRIRKEKDKYVFKEFELQQKLQDLQSKHKSLREDHESLKQGNYQIQQNTKKNNKIHQDMRKKIAKLESKIKSMDKVTLRKGTQTTEVFDKDVHEALRIAEESLQVTQAELKEAVTKSKAAQQEAEDLKKLLNAKGREINKRERKSKKDEETVRFITRERDSMETKLRKVTEQLEYYKGMMEIRTKGGKRQVPEKKEVRVQRCSSGRHVLLKTHVAAGCHQSQEDTKNSARNDAEESKAGTGKRNSLTNGNAAKQAKQNATTTKQTPQTQGSKQNDQQSTNKSTTKGNASNSTTNSSSAAKSTGNAAQKTSTANSSGAAATKTVSGNKTNSSTSKPNGNANSSTTSSTPKTSINTSSAQKATNSDSKSQANKSVTNKDSDKSSAKPIGTESPKLANKRLALATNSDLKQQTGNNSPGTVKRQIKPDEKPVRPKAATVRQTAPATNEQKR
ncbi:uncharacterized protein LOC120347533 [Styela clava]